MLSVLEAGGYSGTMNPVPNRSPFRASLSRGSLVNAEKKLRLRYSGF